ncbi:anthranilate phosphoribosyltransferase [Terrihabitans rhizophilus]|jgi:anthranilate phosphoribosyltransferase|uniref:Anthranilate phosphoribosyltransferase n=1 Tax=Terrihabitans rhizophilus TaxID=3092662 RepID=A0ABU4RKL9_9HYPH|nr:anthranilate phosphoribosyltransferase [Terrihabitans sp. PJ23]MDX6805388.1 anthranilate phosphoribosyltransferase [Terrihabitans sp. PJ23]
MERFRPFIARVADGRPLSRQEATEAFGIIMSGEATAAQIGAFLMALRVRGEAVDEIAAAVSVMRAKMTPVHAPAGAVDVVGTGGDNAGSYNISTCASFIVAGAGVPVAKHGNRALSSKSGAADVLVALGVNIDLIPAEISRCIREAGIGFMFAPNHHTAMRYVGPARAELGIRTIFNILGPLSNPAGVTRQMVGVFSRSWIEPIANALLALGTTHSWIVHGSDGMDEITNTAHTYVAEVKNGTVRHFEIEPEHFGLTCCQPADLKGGDAAFNAAALIGVLNGARTAYRDVSVMNAAAALVVAGRTTEFAEAVQMAQASVDRGAARERLDALIDVSNRTRLLTQESDEARDEAL